jgi:peroxiredoxin
MGLQGNANVFTPFIILKLVLALLIFSFFSCSEPDRNFTIRGSLENAEGSMLLLYEMGTYELIPFDSVIVGDNGEFSFQGEIDQVKFMSLRKTQINYLTLIVFPGEDIEIKADLNNLQGTAVIKGSAESRLAAELNGRMHSTLMSLDSLSRRYRDMLGQEGVDIDLLRNETRERHEEITEGQRQFTIDFINSNPGSLASLMALYQQTDPNNFVLGREEDFKYYSLVDSVLIGKYPDLGYTLTLNENVGEMKRQLGIREQRENLLLAGTEVPEISLPTPRGDTVSLSSLRGNYILLDFWAAWCGPCRKENPYLVDSYNKYSDKGFDIYQVSLDRTREAWIRGIEEDGLDRWTHVSDLQFWSSVVVPLFNISGIPANFLLDPEGRIVEKNLRGAALGNKLEELLN